MRRIEIDPTEVRQLAMIGCTTETIVHHFRCSRDTIERRFRYELDEGRSDGEIRVRGKLFQRAMNGSQRALEVCAVNLPFVKPQPSKVDYLEYQRPLPGQEFSPVNPYHDALNESLNAQRERIQA